MDTIAQKNGQIFPLADASQFIGYWGAAVGAESRMRALLETLLLPSIVQSLCSPVNQIAIAAGLGATTPEQADAWVEIQVDRLILGRDAFGRVPLYWRQIDQIIWFASRLQLLLPLDRGIRSVDLAAIYGYTCFSYVPNPLTPVTGIFSLAAGTTQTWEASTTIDQPRSQRLQQWREYDDILDDETVAIAELQTQLKQAIDRQISDLDTAPVGILLSGGLDSAVVAALLVHAGVSVRAYSLDFGDVDDCELPYAAQVAQHLDIPLVKVDASPRRVQAALIPTVQALDLPFGDGVTVPLYLLCQAASQEVKVIFNGEGGDQLFAGWTNKPLIAAGIYQSQQPHQPDDFERQYLRTFHRLWGYEAQVYQPNIAAQIQQLSPTDWLHDALDPAFSTSLLPRLRRASLMLKGAQNIHPRTTAIAAAHGLKVRSPFCDPALTDWTFRLSGSLMLQGSCEKYILKRAVADWLPDDIVWRQKRGMGVPLTARCFNQWWRSLGHWLNPDRLRQAGIWQPDLAARIVAGELAGPIQGRRIGEILWLLIMWEMWRSQVLGEDSSQRSWDHPFWVPRQIWSYHRRWQA
jgi:asparagine synthase (glutamine-hydrolysing)